MMITTIITFPKNKVSRFNKVYWTLHLKPQLTRTDGLFLSILKKFMPLP